MLRKKYVVQKSIRIDAQLAEDLEKLAKILDRPQSELINLAIENLLVENRLWFKNYIFVDALSDVFERGTETVKYEIIDKNVKTTVSLSIDDNLNYILSWELRDEIDYNNVIDSLKTSYPDTPEAQEQLINKLIELTIYLDENSDGVQNYLKHRLDYK